MTPLTFLNPGEKGEVAEILSKGRGFRSHLRDMGILEGKVLEVLKNNCQGPILVKIDEAKIVIGKGVAMKILVRRIG